jgi:diguanylate cyclase (GGDEF)-like protein
LARCVERPGRGPAALQDLWSTADIRLVRLGTYHLRHRRRGSRSGVPRLVQRFALLSGVAFLVVVVAVIWFVRQSATSHAKDVVGAQASFTVNTILRDTLVRSDFAQPVGSKRRAELDRLFKHEILAQGGLRAKLYGPDGTTTYATDHELIGERNLEEDLTGALGGVASTEVGSLNGEGGAGPNVKALSAYVPMTFFDGQYPVGAFEVYQSYAPVAAAARAEYVPVAIVLGLGLLALYLSLFPVLRRVTRRLEEHVGEIRYQALHDALTGLPNRDLFHDRLSQTIALERREAGRAAVILIDLDRFKEINDTLGHQSGDDLLKQVGSSLALAVRESDTVARLGGDEFAIVSPRTDADGALALADKLRESLARPITVGGIELEIDASMGIALFPEHGADAETLMRRADVALYLSKDAHAPSLYVAEQDHYSPERLALVSDLRRAVASRDELVVFFQPQADLATGEIVRAEALVRWRHPSLGLLTPDVFLPLAERTGLMRPLTRHVLDASLQQCRAWRDRGLDVEVAVNVSGRDLLDLALPDEVTEALERFGVPADRLELEITEDTILTDPVRARSVLERLSTLGVSLAIDDFGAGYSSLGYLKRLSVDVLKIDRSFVMNMASDENDAVIVRSTIDLGHNLGLRVVAEGVEDEQTMRRLGELDCDVAQGYFLGRPTPAEGLDALLARSGRRLRVRLGSAR